MQIKVLGTRGEIKASAPYHSKKSGVFINNTILLDIGEESFLHHQPTAIFITHLHPDHAYFVRKGNAYASTTPLYAPETYQGLPIKVINHTMTVATYTITPIPTVHSIKVKSQAYLIEHGNKKILYTGDMIWIEKQYHHLLHNLDLVITEASSFKAGGLIRRDKKTGNIFGHTGIPNLVKFFASYTNTMLFVHFGTWFYADKEKRKLFTVLAKEYNVTIMVGYDGLELTI